MKYFTTLRKHAASYAVCIAVLFLAGITRGQTAPPLGTAATLGVFSSEGTISNTGLTVVTGDIGAEDSAITGFPPGLYSGNEYKAGDSASVKIKDDVGVAYSLLDNNTCDTTISASMGSGQTLISRTYCTTSATSMGGILTLDAKGDPNAIFIFKISGSLTTAANTVIVLANQAQAKNVYWRVDGTVTLGANTTFVGTIVSNGTITFDFEATLEGRALATNGNVILLRNTITVPAGIVNGSIVIVRPSAGDSIGGGVPYQIRWTGTAITNKKTLDYSLDSGKTWTLIATIDSNVSAYDWNVPDSTSKKVIVRIIDNNADTGRSGTFTIESTKDNTVKYTIISPAFRETIAGGTQNYIIRWTGPPVAALKIIEYSLDSGLTWKQLGIANANVNSLSWNVPDTTVKHADIRITDVNGATGKSGIFSILSTKTAGIVITRPFANEVIIGGTQNYQITWSGNGIATQKTFDYSLDNGLTWKLIGVLNADTFTFTWNVPDTTSNSAIVRITDKNGLVGTSAGFSILSSNSHAIVVLRPATGENIPGGTQNYQITWTGTGIAAQKTIELSTDNGTTWTIIGALNSTAMSYNWNVPNIATNGAIIRITDQNNLTGKSGVFTIGSGSDSSIVIVTPASGETIVGGSQNYQITFTGIGIASQKTFEYSTDNGVTWNLIGFTNSNTMSYTWQNVPNVNTTLGRVRITDINGTTGTSGQFTITGTPGDGTFTMLCLGGLVDNNIGNGQHMTIDWMTTGDVGTYVDVQASTNGGDSWQTVATILASEIQHTVWTTPATGTYTNALIRIVSSKGIRIVSPAFTIGLNAGVILQSAEDGYSVSNYPNPVRSTTNIAFILASASDVTLTINDGSGREVAIVMTQHLEAGTHNAPFNASGLADGMYNYILHAGSTTLVGRMIVVK